MKIKCGLESSKPHFILYANRLYFDKFAIVAIIVAIDASPVPIDSHCAMPFPVDLGLLGTIISHPGSGFAPFPTLATMPFIYTMYVWLFFERIPYPPAWFTYFLMLCPLW